MEKKNNTLALVSLCLALGNIVLFIVLANMRIELTMILLICFLVCLGAAVTGIIGVTQINKNENMSGKGMSIAGIVLGFLGILFFGLGYMGLKMLSGPEFAKQFCVNEQLVNDCVDNGDGTAKCLYSSSTDITCQIEDLKESQYKK